MKTRLHQQHRKGLLYNNWANEKRQRDESKVRYLTKLHGEKPSPEKILEMASNRYKGLTYQKMGNEISSKVYQGIPKVVPPSDADLSIDLGN